MWGVHTYMSPLKNDSECNLRQKITRIKNGHIEITPSQHRVLSWLFFMSPKVSLIFNIVFLFTFLCCFWSSVSKLLFFLMLIYNISLPLSFGSTSFIIDNCILLGVLLPLVMFNDLLWQFSTLTLLYLSIAY